MHHGMHATGRRSIGTAKNTRGLLITRCGANVRPREGCRIGASEREPPIAELIRVFQRAHPNGRRLFRTCLATLASPPKRGSRTVSRRTGVRCSWSRRSTDTKVSGCSWKDIFVGTDESLDRELFAFLRGVFIARRDVRTFRAKFLDVEYPGNNKIPEGATEYYLYAGEAGRRQNYAQHLCQRNNRYRRQIVEAFDRDVRLYPKEKTPPATVTMGSTLGEGNETGNSSFELLSPIPKMRHVPGIRLEIPYLHFGWESYHSSHNDFSGFDLPAPSVIQRLRLASKNREIDFYDSKGKPGTLYREAGCGWKGDRHSLLYVRADLLQRYLTDTRQVLIWCNWGERDWLKKMEDHEVLRNPARLRIFQAYGHVHRSFLRWSAKDRKVV